MANEGFIISIIWIFFYGQFFATWLDGFQSLVCAWGLGELYWTSICFSDLSSKTRISIMLCVWAEIVMLRDIMEDVQVKATNFSKCVGPNWYSFSLGVVGFQDEACVKCDFMLLLDFVGKTC